MRRVCDAIAVTVAVFVLSSSSAFAQASISGVVRDSSGGVLPGVTVEASSPDLIERVRASVTDGDGQYRIVDLRAGTYTLTFSLPGFSTVRREGVQLAGSFVATINVQLSVGAVQETVVVTGESPLVDVQSVSRQTTMDNDLINAIPAARSYGGLMTLMPNTVVQGGAASNAQVVPNMVVFGGAGGRTNEGRLQVDGLSVGTAFNGAGVSAYVADVNNAQEVVLTSSGGMGEAEAGGPTLNIVPKEGGNRISGQAYFAQVSEGMIGSNYTDELKARGLTTPGSYTKIWDYNLGIGGPIMRDRLWYFLQVRNEGYENTIPGMFANQNAGDPTKWFYVPDRSRPAAGAASFQTTALRLTSQLTPRNKITVFWDEQVPCEGAAFGNAEGCRSSGDDRIICAGASPTPACSATTAPEAGAYRNVGQRVQQARWTSPLTSRMLAEAGLGTYSSHWGGKPMPGANPDLIRVQDQCLVGSGVAGAPCEHGIANLSYRSPNWGDHFALVLNYRGSVSYVAGSHSLKVGYQGSHLGDNRLNYSNQSSLSYRFNNGVPNQLTQTLNGFELLQRVRTTALYAQDAWTMGRMTLQGALRYDRAWSYFPEQTVGPHVFFPTAKTYAFTKGSTYNDLSPRGGVAMDVFGNGKTSVKFNVGRYLEAAQNGGFFITNNPTGRLQTTSSRTWGDADLDFVPDCNLLDQNANGECGVGNRNFGTEVVSSTLDPSLVTGWGVRTGDWQWGAAIQQQVMPRVSAEVTYQHRWLMNFSATDNRNVAVTDYDAFSLNVPVDSRLPDGGGGQLSGLYNITAAANTRLTDNFVTLADRFGEYSQATDSVSLNVTARPRFGLTLQGGFNWARTQTDACDIHHALPEYTIPLGGIIATTNPWCATNVSLFRTTALGSYTVPKADVQLGFTFRSDQGASLAANYTASPANTTLGRPFAGASSTISVNLVEPGTLYGDRVNQFDLRVAKVLRFGRTTTNVGVDLFNLLNASPVLTYNEAFTATWLRPNSVLQARFMKISAQIGF